MNWIVTNFDWVLIVTGALTATMILPMLVPRFALNYLFGPGAGDVTASPVAVLITRSWGQLIFASGLFLIYAAFDEAVRMPVLIFAIVGKAVFIALVFSNGTRFLGRPAGQAAMTDIVMIALFLWYLQAVWAA